jgi:ferredoxin-NADP reductase
MNHQTATVLHKKELTPLLFEICFQLETAFEFEFGQFITILVPTEPRPTMRSYSIRGYDASSNQLTLRVKRVKGGLASGYIDSLAIGNEMKFIGPYGKFTLHHPEGSFYFFSNETGLVPFLALIEKHVPEMPEQNFHMLFSTTPDNLEYYIPSFAEYQEEFPHFTYEIFAHKERAVFHQQHFEAIQNLQPEPQSNFFISGDGDFVKGALDILTKTKGVEREKIEVEKHNSL